MIGVELLFEIIKLTLLTAYLKEEKPVSLLIISDRPESGKTEIIKNFNGTKVVALVTDATAYGIWRDFHKELREGKIKHILFPDFLTPLSRQKPTVESLITTLNALIIEEGLSEIHTGFLEPINIESSRPIGVILAMIRGPYEKHKKTWIQNSFLSRLLVLSYRFSDKRVKDIFKSILMDEYRSPTKLSIPVPNQPQSVECPLEMGVQLKLLMDDLKGEGEHVYGFRMLKDLRRLAMASALADNRDVVDREDVDKVKALSSFFNERYEELS